MTKGPVMRHVNRASNRRIARFKKRMKKIQADAGTEWTVGVLDETIVVRFKPRNTRWETSGPYIRTTDPTPRSSSDSSLLTEEDSSKPSHGTQVVWQDLLTEPRSTGQRSSLNGEVRLVFLPPGC